MFNCYQKPYKHPELSILNCSDALCSMIQPWQDFPYEDLVRQLTLRFKAAELEQLQTNRVGTKKKSQKVAE